MTGLYRVPRLDNRLWPAMRAAWPADLNMPALVSKSSSSPDVQPWRTTKDRSPIRHKTSPRPRPGSWSISVDDRPRAALVLVASLRRGSQRAYSGRLAAPLGPIRCLPSGNIAHTATSTTIMVPTFSKEPERQGPGVGTSQADPPAGNRRVHAPVITNSQPE
jgi:hypothetical protein